jgi:hypothetical protein
MEATPPQKTADGRRGRRDSSRWQRPPTEPSKREPRQPRRDTAHHRLSHRPSLHKHATNAHAGEISGLERSKFGLKQTLRLRSVRSRHNRHRAPRGGPLQKGGLAGGVIRRMVCQAWR